MNNNSDFDVILFDLGGVLVQFTDRPKIFEWTKASKNELWNWWLSSEIVRNFETGKINSVEFAQGAIKELKLGTEVDTFLKEFSSWPIGLFPGTDELLQRLSNSFKLSTLCNTNEIYWKKYKEMGLLDIFQYKFASHEIGLLKPDIKIFNFVVNKLQVSSKRILFFDDNLANIDSANSIGIKGYKVAGLSNVISKLVELNILNK